MICKQNKGWDIDLEYGLNGERLVEEILKDKKKIEVKTDRMAHLTGNVAVDTDGAIHGAALVSYFNRPSNRVAFVTAIGGKLVSNRSTWAQFESIMRSNGATYLEGAARESIVRLWSRYGMQHKYHIVGKSL